MTIKKQNKKVMKKTKKKSTTQKKSASSVKSKKSTKKTISKTSKKPTAKKQKSLTSPEKPLKEKPKKASKQKKFIKNPKDKKGSVLGKIQTKISTLKKKAQDSLLQSDTTKKKQKKTVTKNPKVIKKQAKKPTSQILKKSLHKISAPSKKRETITPHSKQKLSLEKTTVQKKSLSINKLEIAKKELDEILKREKEEKLILKDMEGRSYCCVEDCGFSAEVEGYCRLHYIGHWEYITKRNKILKSNLIEKFIHELISEYSPGILHYLLQDLKQEKNFNSSVKTLLEEDEEIESEDTLLS